MANGFFKVNLANQSIIVYAKTIAAAKKAVIDNMVSATRATSEDLLIYNNGGGKIIDITGAMEPGEDIAQANKAAIAEPTLGKGAPPTADAYLEGIAEHTAAEAAEDNPPFDPDPTPGVNDIV